MGVSALNRRQDYFVKQVKWLKGFSFVKRKCVLVLETIKVIGVLGKRNSNEVAGREGRLF